MLLSLPNPSLKTMALTAAAAAHPIGFTNRLTFQWWNDQNIKHVELANHLWGNEEVTRLIGGPFNQEQINARFAKECQRRISEGYQYWPLFVTRNSYDDGDDDDDNNSFIGVCGLQRYNGPTSVARGLSNMVEIGFHLLPKYWRKGYGTEAGEAVIRYALETLRVDAIYAGHHPLNIASSTALCKLGFVCIGKEYYAGTGLMHPSYIMCSSEK